MEPAQQTKVSVKAINYDYSDEEDNGKPSWHMVFEVQSGEIFCAFDSEEPYLCSLVRWRELAQGKGKLSLYCGNGEGSITALNGHYLFHASPSGAGGDVYLEVKVPVSIMSKALDAALDDAIASGFWFAE
jgi:hypothetical protein